MVTVTFALKTSQTSSVPKPAEPSSAMPNDAPTSNVPDSNHTPPPPDNGVATTVITAQITKPNTSTSHSYTSNTASAGPQSSSTQTPMIAGAAAGGTAFLALAIGTVLYILRRRKHTRSLPSRTESWDPSGGMHGKRTLPDAEQVGEVGMRGGGWEKVELSGDDMPDRYGTRSPMAAAPPHSNMRSDQMGDTVGYQELESRSPTLMSVPASPAPGHTLHPVKSWHALSPSLEQRGANEVHGESAVGSPLIRKGGGDPGKAELRGDSNSMAVGREHGFGHVELDAGQEAQPRYYASADSGNGEAVRVAQNF
ncbi:hypothetical protein EK21DRAFT_89392 [Setomelanomma holmii]|uniref:Uncharacterized protein n=1 Tax=Setomelanomma holmii TaxID=210430 RepID=A0A9P4H8Z4_9PLEO|nr:hypothetical protein EK21DRAFT_89392 [Setomelanomma holmii]